MNKKGLSLLEVLIAAFILSLVVTGLLAVFISGKTLVLHSRARMTGGELGTYFLDPLQQEVRQDKWDNNCLSNTSNCVTQNETLGGIEYSANYSTSNVDGTTNLRRVTVNIIWNEPAP